MRALRIFAFLFAFLGAGLFTIVRFDTYFTDFWKIRNCNVEGGYENDLYMTDCYGISGTDRYTFGAIVLGTEKAAVESIRDADVIILGNSRTLRSFATTPVDEFFAARGLRYFILATEGTSFRGTIYTLNNVEMDPKILLVNNEIFFVDQIPEAFGELIQFPEKYETRFAFFGAAQRLQRWSCGRDVPVLTEFYCNGTNRPRWRSHRTGRVQWNLEAPPEQQKPITPRTGGERVAGQKVEWANEFFDSIDITPSCTVLYNVTSPNTDTGLLVAMGKALRLQAVHAEVEGLQSYDNSHLDRPNSERWAEDFLPRLDRALRNCEDPDFEVPSVWDETLSPDMSADLGGFALPDGVELLTDLREPETGTAFDTVRFTQSLQRLIDKGEDVPVKAGETWEMTVTAWSPDTLQARVQFYRGCSGAPVEGANTIATFGPVPVTVTVRHTYSEDHGCQFQVLQNFTEGGGRLNVAQLVFRRVPDGESDTP